MGYLIESVQFLCDDSRIYYSEVSSACTGAVSLAQSLSISKETDLQNMDTSFFILYTVMQPFIYGAMVTKR